MDTSLDAVVASPRTRRVAVAATYTDGPHLIGITRRRGVEVVHLGGQGIVTAQEVARLGRDDVLGAVREKDHPEAAALLLPDTALHAVSWLGSLRRRRGSPF